jgi:molybdate transport system substrate-binding protein
MRQSRPLLRYGVALLFLIWAGLAEAGDIKVLCSQAFTEAMADLVPVFERETGHHVNISFGTTGAIAGRIERGEPADVVILTTPALEWLTAIARLTEDRVEIARSLVGIAVRPGMAVPDLSSVDNLKRFLLQASSIAYPDPSSGGASGLLFTHALETLGIMQAVQAKVRLVPGGAGVGELVSRGEADVAVHMISELKPVRGIDLVGPLPPSLQTPTVFAAGFGLLTFDPSTARAFVAFLITPPSADVLRAKGLVPIAPNPMSSRSVKPRT